MFPFWMLLQQNDGDGDNWSYDVQISSQNVTNIQSPKHFYRLDALPVAQPCQITEGRTWVDISEINFSLPYTQYKNTNKQISIAGWTLESNGAV